MNQINRRHTCMIVDDEANAIEVIEHHLANFPSYEVVSKFHDGMEASQFMKTHTPDLIFLDIQMPGINGLDFLRSLRNPPKVFLTTAYRHYAPEAFELEVLDYLLKPISLDRFRKAIEKYEISILGDKDIVKLPHNEILVRANRSNIKVDILDILYLEAMGDYVKIHLVTGNLITKETLKSLMKRLPFHLFRQIHRSYVVNTKQVRVESAQFVEILGIRLPVSRIYRNKK